MSCWPICCISPTRIFAEHKFVLLVVMKYGSERKWAEKSVLLHYMAFFVVEMLVRKLCDCTLPVACAPWMNGRA